MPENQDRKETLPESSLSSQTGPAFLLEQAVAETERSTATVAAAAASAINGGLHILAALQLWSLVHLFGLYNIVPYAMVGLGALFIALGSRIYGQRVLAVRAVIVVGTIDMMAMGGWLLLTVGSGMFSLLIMVVPAGSLSAALLAFFAHGACIRTSAARRRAAQAGLDIDL